MKSRQKKNRAKPDQTSGGGGWEIVYSGFVLILLCFFIMLSSFSSIEEAKVMRFVRSFVDAVSILPGGLKADGGTAIVPIAAEMVDSDSPLAKLYDDLQKIADRLSHRKDIAVYFTRRGLVMRLSDHALFDAGVAEISPKALPLLQKVGTVIAETTYEIRVEGHTDDVPIQTARYPTNWELSTARAVNVLRYLIRTFQIPRERLSAEGFGEYQPMVPNDNVANRAKNRRVEIVFLNPNKPGLSTESGS